MSTIDNPEYLPPQLIYNYDHGTNETWNMPEYRAPRQYLDPNLQVLQRKWASQKKGDKNRNYVTKRGFYMDYDLKVAKSIPGSSTIYITQISMVKMNHGHSKNNQQCQNFVKLTKN